MDVKVEEAEIKDDAKLITRRGPEDQGCSELGDRGKCMEEMCTGLDYEAELLDLRKKNDELKERIAWLENEQKSSSGMNDKSESPKFVDLTAAEEKENTMFELMIENKALECEKQKAEKDAELWKGKFEELVSWVLGRDEKVVEDLCRWLDSNGPSLQNEIMDLKKKLFGGIGSVLGRRVRKQLVFESEDGPAKKIDPPTPGVAKHFATSTIDINDSDDDVESDTAHLPVYKRIRKQGSRRSSESAKDVSSVQTPKRKRGSRVVTSDTDSDDDDGVRPLRLKKLHVIELSNDGVISSEKMNARAVSTAADVDEDDDSETRDVESASEGESLGGFIVSDGDNASTESEDACDSEAEDITNRELEDFSDSEAEDMSNRESEGGSDSETDYAKVISTIRRKKRECKPSEWQFEGDMLAAFGKDPELCLKAVCALYRQQTADERVSKEALYNNRRGFSKFDAPRGSKLGDFLTGGDPEGDLNKSVKELQEHGPKAVELCRTMATHYSKRLFEIYQTKEDPFFLPR